MKNRIKKLRKELNMTQQGFAGRLGIKGNTISQYESGRNEPIDAVISLICREFRVNEEWLRTGRGEMFSKQEEGAAIDRLCAELNATHLEAEALRLYFQIDAKVRDAFIQHLFKVVETECIVPNPSPASSKSDLATHVTELRRQLAAEKARADRAEAEAKERTEELLAVYREDEAARRAEEERSFHSKPDGKTGLLA